MDQWMVSTEQFIFLFFQTFNGGNLKQRWGDKGKDLLRWLFVRGILDRHSKPFLCLLPVVDMPWTGSLSCRDRMIRKNQPISFLWALSHASKWMLDCDRIPLPASDVHNSIMTNIVVGLHYSKNLLKLMCFPPPCKQYMLNIIKYINII